MNGTVIRSILLNIVTSAIVLQALPAFAQTPRPPFGTLKTRIESVTRSVNARDFLPYIGNDVGVLEATGKRVVVSIFTANHFGMGTILEDAIGRITEQVAGYFGNR